MKIKHYKDKGFALLFAILTASLLLTVGLSIYNISMKELVITGYNEESKQAIYASHAGMECALYWGIYKMSWGKFDGFTGTSNQICGKEVAEKKTNGFTVYLTEDKINGPCAVVKVATSTTDSTTITEATSIGYNTCDATDSRRVERVFKWSKNDSVTP